MSWPWKAAQVVLHDHGEDAPCNDRCIEVPRAPAEQLSNSEPTEWGSDGSR